MMVVREMQGKWWRRAAAAVALIRTVDHHLLFDLTSSPSGRGDHLSSSLAPVARSLLTLAALLVLHSLPAALVVPCRRPSPSPVVHSSLASQSLASPLLLPPCCLPFALLPSSLPFSLLAPSRLHCRCPPETGSTHRQTTQILLLPPTLPSLHIDTTLSRRQPPTSPATC